MPPHRIFLSDGAGEKNAKLKITLRAFDNVGMTTTLENGGVYNIVAKHSNKALDVTGAGTANGTIVNQYPVTAGYQWQRWKLQYYGDGAYKIIDMNSEKLLSISGSSPNVSEVCHIWADDGTTGQLFRIRENRDGSYSLLSKCSNYQYVLSVGGGSTENGQIAYQYFDWGYDYQKFSFNESVADIDFILPVIEELYRYACEYVPNKSVRYRRRLVLQYIRHEKYNDEEWDTVAGEIDEAFIKYVDSKNSFMSIQLNADAPTSAGAFIYDSNGNKIDFYHLCATLNALLYNSSVFEDYRAAIGEDHIDDLAGWAGDLQTMIRENLYLQIKDSEDYNFIYNLTYQTIGESSSYFSMEDLFSDVDAINIKKELDSKKYLNLVDALNIYYDGLYSNRYYLFVNNLLKTDENELLNQIENKLYTLVREYTTQKSTVPLVKWPLLSNIELSNTQSNAIAQAFTDFIMARYENER